jgi:hypothetical protein
MAKKDLKDALGASVRAEQDAVADRFAKAEAYFGKQDNQPRKAAPPTPRQKVIRDGFTMPAGDYALIDHVRAKSMQSGYAVTKSEVLRAGLHVLNRMSPVELEQVLETLEKVKPGRPAKQV